MYRWLAVLLLLCSTQAALSAVPTNLRFTARVNPDGRISTKFLNGDAPPASATLNCDSVAFLAGIPSLVNQLTGTAFSHNVLQYFTGTGTGSATYSVVTKSGDDATAEGWSISGNNLVHPGSQTGSGTQAIRGTVAGNRVDCPTVSWSYIAPVTTDTLAATIPTGLTLSLDGNGDPVLVWDAASDPKISTQDASGLDYYQVKRGGSNLTQVDVSAGLSAQLADHIIGSYTSAGDGSSQNGAIHTLTASGSMLSDTADEGLIRSVPLAGNWTLIAKPTGMTGSTADSGRKACLIARASLSTSAPSVALCTTPTQTRLQYRLTDGANRVSGTPVSTSFPVWQRLRRSGDTFTADYSTNGRDWTLLGPIDLSAMGSTPEVGLAASSFEDGVPVVATIEQVNLNQVGTVTHTDTTAAPSTTYSYTVAAVDDAASPNVSSDSVSASIATPAAPSTVEGLLLEETWESGNIASNRWGIPNVQLQDGIETREVSTDFARHGSRSLKLHMLAQPLPETTTTGLAGCAYGSTSVNTTPNPDECSRVDSHDELVLKLDQGWGNPIELNDERWFGFAVYLPASYVAHTVTNKTETYFQIHSSDIPAGDTESNPPFSIFIDQSNWRSHADARTGTSGSANSTSKTFGAITPGVWQEFVVYVDWHYSSGEIKVWTKRAGDLWPGQSSASDPINTSDAAASAWASLANTRNYFFRTNGIGYNRAAPSSSRGTVKVGLYIPAWRVNGPQAGRTSRTIYHDTFRSADETGSFDTVNPSRAP